MLPLEVLQTKFGYSSFRLEQQAIIHAVLQKQDTFVLMPTGGGKSLCYQVPALIFEGLTIVISPLISLMKDQVDALRVNGIPASYINSTQSAHQQEDILRRATRNELKLLYLAPESAHFKRLMACHVSLIAIDEAHCISHWGHDFRPEYLMLAHLKKSMPDVPIIALTATADRITRTDILNKLGLHKPLTFISSFNRANIRYTVEPKKNSFQELIAFLKKRKEESGIIYCLSRIATESLAENLKLNGFEALPYHAGLEKDVRSKHKELFIRDEVKIIVATIAFGMGIDKSNVRFVVHMDLPKNIESYYQETGRAGRDGVDSEALLFFSYSDVFKMRKFVEIDGNPEQSRIYLRKLEQMATYGDLRTCRRKFLLNYFDESAPDNCGNCDVCLSVVERTDGTVLAQKLFSAISRVQEHFGAKYIIDFLVGAQTAKIQDGHKLSKTFGIGSDTAKETWRNIIDDLLAQGYITKTTGKYPVLKLTHKCEGVLKGTHRVMLIKSIKKMEVAETITIHEVPLYRQLKDLRRQLAAVENVPPYIILSDATLIELATWLPQEFDAFSHIPGFGMTKLRKYFKPFGEVINNYCRDNGLTSRIYVGPSRAQKSERPERNSETKQITLDLFRKGHSITKISELRKLTPSTIENHLGFYIQQGKLNLEDVIDPGKIILITQTIENGGDNSLTALKEQLGDACSYGEIQMVRSVTRNLKGSRAVVSG